VRPLQNVGVQHLGQHDQLKRLPSGVSRSFASDALAGKHVSVGQVWLHPPAASPGDDHRIAAVLVSRMRLPRRLGHGPHRYRVASAKTETYSPAQRNEPYRVVVCSSCGAIPGQNGVRPTGRLKHHHAEQSGRKQQHRVERCAFVAQKRAVERCCPDQNPYRGLANRMVPPSGCGARPVMGHLWGAAAADV